MPVGPGAGSGIGSTRYGNSTTTLIDGSKSLDGTTTIEWITFSGARTNSYIQCGDFPNNTSLWHNSGQGFVAGYLLAECGDYKNVNLITVEISAGSVADVHLTYYNQSMQTALAATNTPYTERTQFVGNTEYNYDPLKAQVGIALWLVIFIITAWVVINIFRKK